MFFDIPIEVKNSLVSLPMLVADDLFVDIFLGANQMKAVSAIFIASQLEIFIKLEKLNLEKLWDPTNDFNGSR